MNHWWVSLLTHICVGRHQRVKVFQICSAVVFRSLSDWWWMFSRLVFAWNNDDNRWPLGQSVYFVIRGKFVNDVYIDGLVPDCSNSLELLQTCTKPSISYPKIKHMVHAPSYCVWFYTGQFDLYPAMLLQWSQDSTLLEPGKHLVASVHQWKATMMLSVNTSLRLVTKTLNKTVSRFRDMRYLWLCRAGLMFSQNEITAKN